MQGIFITKLLKCLTSYPATHDRDTIIMQHSIEKWQHSIK